VSPHIRFEFSPDTGIGEILLDRPSKLNALSREDLALLLHAAQRVEEENAKVVVIRSTTTKAFSAGADLGDFGELDAFEAYRASELGTRALNALARVSCPVIAQISGYCIGGGLELALACDLRLADDTAIFSFPEVTLGETTGWGGLARLLALVGPGWTKDLLLSARRMKAEEAYRIGLVQSVAKEGDLPAAVRELTEILVANPRAAQASIKRDVDVLTEPSRLTEEHQTLRSALNASLDADHQLKTRFLNRKAMDGAGGK
jgi:enoyl-CoA hydratase/carnithine racemase